MSSNIYIRFDEPVNLRDWSEFCKENKIMYLKSAASGNVFVALDVQIKFGTVPIETNEPAGGLIIGAHYTGNLESACDFALAIIQRFGGWVKFGKEYIDVLQYVRYMQH